MKDVALNSAYTGFPAGAVGDNMDRFTTPVFGNELNRKERASSPAIWFEGAEESTTRPLNSWPIGVVTM